MLAFGSYTAEHKTHFSLLAERYLADPRVKELQFLTALDLAAAPRAEVQNLGPVARRLADGLKGAPSVASVTRVDFADEGGARSLLDEWDENGELWYAEPNGVSQLSQEPDPAAPNIFTQQAESYERLNYWWLKSINVAQAFASIAQRDLAVPGTPTDADVVADRPIVAVLDSGVDYEHPALKDRMWINSDQGAANCSNDLHGCNTTVVERGKLGNGDVYPFGTTGPGQSCGSEDSNCSHGTHVAGLVAADSTWSDPSTGRATGGMCPVCQIMVLKIVSKIGKDSGILDSSIIAAFKYVALFRREGSAAVRVINASFGKFVRSRTVGLMIRLMKEKRGALVVGAAGNEDTLSMEYPAAFSDAVAVAAVDSKLRKVSFSNFGHWVDIAAPGSNLLSTIPGGELDLKSGTSMASPVVAGVAGLMVARYPGISFEALRGWLLKSADPGFYSREFEKGFNYHYYYPKLDGEEARTPLLGLGLLNAYAAINLTPSQNLPVFANLDRVQPGCSRIPGNAPGGTTSTVLLLVSALLFPLFGAHIRQVTRATLRYRRSTGPVRLP